MDFRKHCLFERNQELCYLKNKQTDPFKKIDASHGILFNGQREYVDKMNSGGYFYR
jgi:hypothetical protein